MFLAPVEMPDAVYVASQTQARYVGSPVPVAFELPAFQLRFVSARKVDHDGWFTVLHPCA
jgi:hypothetical protein